MRRWISPTFFLVPLLPDLEKLVLKQFAKLSEAHRWSGLCRRLACVHGQEEIGCGPTPPMDQGLGALVSPTKSVLGKPSCPRRNTKMMDAMLARMHGAVAIQGQLVKTGAILALCQRQEKQTEQLEEGGSNLAAEVQQVSLLLAKLMKEQVVVTGRAMASLWMVRRHLWLSQSWLQGEDRPVCLGCLWCQLPCLGLMHIRCSSRPKMPVGVLRRYQIHQEGEAELSVDWVLFMLLPNFQKRWETQTNLGFERAQQVSETPGMQDDDCAKGSTGHFPRQLVFQDQPRLQAVYLALLHFLPEHVLVRTDRTVAAVYINRQGGWAPLAFDDMGVGTSTVQVPESDAHAGSGKSPWRADPLQGSSNRGCIQGS